MRKIVIPRGLHISINQFSTIVKTDYYVKDVVFDTSCIYTLPKEEVLDWNKLLGFSIGLFPTDGIRPMHYNSVRFGWRYNIETNMIEVAPYYYIKGVRWYPETDGKFVISLEFNKRYSFGIQANNVGGYTLWVCDALSNEIIHSWAVAVPQSSKYGWSAPLYFGGNMPAPHEIIVKQAKSWI